MLKFFIELLKIKKYAAASVENNFRLPSWYYIMMGNWEITIMNEFYNKDDETLPQTIVIDTENYILTPEQTEYVTNMLIAEVGIGFVTAMLKDDDLSNNSEENEDTNTKKSTKKRS